MIKKIKLKVSTATRAAMEEPGEKRRRMELPASKSVDGRLGVVRTVGINQVRTECCCTLV